MLATRDSLFEQSGRPTFGFRGGASSRSDESHRSRPKSALEQTKICAR